MAMPSGFGLSQRLGLYQRFGVAMVAGVLAARVVPLPTGADAVMGALVGFVVGALVLALPLLWLVPRLDAGQTAAYAEAQVPTRWVIEVVVVFAALMSVTAIGLMLLGGGNDTLRVPEGLLSLATVASSWLVVHTLYTFRYARHYYLSEPKCVDFPGADEPRLSDFAYLAFTLGMTYQVSDTDLKTARLRRIVLGHTVLSYVFGTVIVAATINLLAGLGK